MTDILFQRNLFLESERTASNVWDDDEDDDGNGGVICQNQNGEAGGE